MSTKVYEAQYHPVDHTEVQLPLQVLEGVVKESGHADHTALKIGNLVFRKLLKNRLREVGWWTDALLTPA